MEKKYNDLKARYNEMLLFLKTIDNYVKSDLDHPDEIQRKESISI